MSVNNGQGQIAVVSTRQASRILVEARRYNLSQDYVFSIRGGTTLAWVEPDDLDKVLAISHQCCGHRRRRPSFRPATLQEAKRWDTSMLQ